MADLKQSSMAPLRTILQLVFDKTPQWWNSKETKNRLEKIKNDVIFKRKLEKYTDRVTHEEDRYKPFCELANHVISLLCPGIKEPHLVIVRNDRIMILGSAATRYPDCVAVDLGALKDPRRGSAANLAKEGPKNLPFAWQELLTFIEFKMQKKHLSKSLEAEFNKHTGSGSQDDHGTKSGSHLGSLMAAAEIIPGEVKPSREGAKSAKRQPGDSPTSPQEQRKRRKTRSQTETEQTLQMPLGSRFGVPLSEGEDFEDIDSEELEDQDDEDSDYQPGPIVKDSKLKQKEPKTRVDYAVQCASYALELLSHATPSTHRVGFSVNDDKIQMQYYDHSRIVVSPEVSFVQNSTILIEILDCLTAATRSHWGFLEDIKPPPQKPLSYNPKTARSSYLSDSTLTCKNNAVLRLGTILFRQHAIICRGTCVVRATSKFPAWDNKNLVVKITFTPVTRPPESKYLGEILNRARADKNADVLDHFPEMLLFQEFPSTATVIQDRFRQYLETSGEAEKVSYEMRNIQLLVVTQLEPVKDLNHGEDVKDVLTGVVKGYLWLYKTMNLLHRDISVENIMYRRRNGKICGVLNDFDLAIYTNEQANSPLSKQRTGTRPFMARDLLDAAFNPCLHLYRHDLESLMYVTVVLACFTHASLDEQSTSPIAQWFAPTATEASIHNAKEAFLKKPIPVPSSTMNCLTDLVTALITLFRKAEAAVFMALVNEGQFDSETLGGVITFQAFEKIFGLNM